MHSICSIGAMDVNKLLNRGLACFCPTCIDCNWGECESRPWVGDWVLEVFIVRNPGYVRAVMLVEFDVRIGTSLG